MTKHMDWGVKPSEECECELYTVVAAAKSKPAMKLQQNLPSDREVLADTINGHYGGISDKRALLEGTLNVYLEHHNRVEEKKADLVETANAQHPVNMEGKVSGWNKLASDSASKQVKHKLGLVEVAVNGQIEHAGNMLDRVIAYEKLHKDAHSLMESAASGHPDFEEATGHHRHLGEKDISSLKTSIQEHISHNKRFLSRIGNANRAIARGVTASFMERDENELG